MKIYNKLLMAVSLLPLLTIGTFAEERSYEDITNVALNFMAEKGQTNLTIDSSKKAAPMASYSAVNYKIINLKPSGWIIVSKDDIAQPILGYSTKGHFDSSSMSPALVDWLNGLDTEIKEAKDANVNNNVSESAWEHLAVETTVFEENLEDNSMPMSTITKGPLLGNIQWGQGSPYNGQTPNNDWVGCSATAMSQIMAYYKWPTHGVGSYSYQHSTYGTISANFDTSYNWNNMSNSDYAKISYHVGVSMDMHYTPNGSGAWPIENNMRAFFKYSLNNKIARDDDENKWHTKIKNDLDNNQPIWYAGFSENLGNGHAFVCDGYRYENNSKFYHFNWGWSGYENGWFSLNAMIASGMNFSFHQYAIFNIRPDTNIKPRPPTNLTISNVTNHGATITWDDNADNESGYRIYINGIHTYTLNANNTSFTLSNLKGNTTYVIEVKAYNSKGESSEIRDYLTTPADPVNAPSNLMATNLTSKSVTLSWKDNSNNEIGFRIYDDLHILNKQYDIVGYTKSNVTTYTIKGLKPNTKYVFSLVAYNYGRESTDTTITINTKKKSQDDIPVTYLILN